jgi:hypothetical protein
MSSNMELEPEEWRVESSNYCYVVRSASENLSRGGGRYSESALASAQTYIVRTRAWNCSCAAFTFSAFPVSTPSFSARLEKVSVKNSRGAVEEKHGEKEATGAWEFGGMSNDGNDGGPVPCCKHLLACVLAEKWDGVLGSYVLERRVGREEMAGIEAET